MLSPLVSGVTGPAGLQGLAGPKGENGLDGSSVAGFPGGVGLKGEFRNRRDEIIFIVQWDVKLTCIFCCQETRGLLENQVFPVLASKVERVHQAPQAQLA